MKYETKKPESSGPRKTIDLSFSNSTEKKKKRVKVFKLSSVIQCAEYEDLLNNEKIKILKEQFIYDKSGNPLITVWWEE